MSAAALTATSRRSFLAFWGGFTAFELAGEVVTLALALVALEALSATPEQIGLLNAALAFPVIVVAVLAGSFVDRGNEARLLSYSSLLRLGASGFVVTLALTNLLSLPVLLAVALLAGTGRTVFDIAYQTLLPQLVGDDDLEGANRRLQGSLAMTSTLGPALAGTLVSALGSAVALVGDAGLCLIAFVFFLPLAAVPAPVAPSRGLGSGSFVSGLRSISSIPALRALTGTAVTANFVEQAFFTVLVIYAIRDLGVEPAALGVALGAAGTGTFAGIGIGSWLSGRMNPGAILVAGAATMGGGMTVMACAAWSPVGAAVWIALAVAIYNLGLVVYNVQAVTLRQRLAPADMLGRVNAAYRLLAFGSIPLGGIAGGLAAVAFGLQTVLGMCAAALMIVTAALSLQRRLFNAVRNG